MKRKTKVKALDFYLELRAREVIRTYTEMCKYESLEKIHKYFQTLNEFWELTKKKGVQDELYLREEEFDKIDALYESKSVNTGDFIGLLIYRPTFEDKKRQKYYKKKKEVLS